LHTAKLWLTTVGGRKWRCRNFIWYTDQTAAHKCVVSGVYEVSDGSLQDCSQSAEKPEFVTEAILNTCVVSAIDRYVFQLYIKPTPQEDYTMLVLS
jgi:hypothetical protein